MIVARQLQKMSKVPRTLGAETKLCRPSAGMVQLGLTSVEASTGTIASSSMESDICTITALVPVPSRAAIPMPLSKRESQAQAALRKRSFVRYGKTMAATKLPQPMHVENGRTPARRRNTSPVVAMLTRSILRDCVSCGEVAKVDCRSR